MSEDVDKSQSNSFTHTAGVTLEMASLIGNPLHEEDGLMDNVSSHVYHNRPSLHPSSSQHSLASAEDSESRMDRIQSLNDHLNRLGEEITSGIITLSGRPADVVYMDVDKLHALAESEELPEVAFTHLLFRKYSELANDLLIRCKASERVHSPSNVVNTSYPGMSMIADELDEHELVGWAATKKAIFWYRFASATFGFLAFAVMSSVPALSETDYNPSYEFSDICLSNLGGYMNGSFNYEPYQLVVAIGVILYFYSLVIAVYYLLPVNANKRKYIPGLIACFQYLGRNRQYCEELADSISEKLRAFPKLALLITDSLVLLLSVLSALIASIFLERSAPFEYANYTTQYYTLGSFFSTFTHTSPQCITFDPCPTIRAALAMLYLGIFVQAFSLEKTHRAYRLEVTTRASGFSGGAGSHDDFRALPLPTNDDEDDVEEVTL